NLVAVDEPEQTENLIAVDDTQFSHDEMENLVAADESEQVENLLTEDEAEQVENLVAADDQQLTNSDIDDVYLALSHQVNAKYANYYEKNLSYINQPCPIFFSCRLYFKYSCD